MSDRKIIAFEKPLNSPDAIKLDMDKEVDVKLTIGDLVNIYDALSQVAANMNDKDFINISCTLDAITEAIQNGAL